MKLDRTYLPVVTPSLSPSRKTGATQVSDNQKQDKQQSSTDVQRSVTQIPLEEAQKTYAEISEQQQKSKLKLEKIGTQYSSHQQHALNSYVNQQHSLNRESMSDVIETLGIDIFV